MVRVAASVPESSSSAVGGDVSETSDDGHFSSFQYSGMTEDEKIDYFLANECGNDAMIDELRSKGFATAALSASDWRGRAPYADDYRARILERLVGLGVARVVVAADGERRYVLAGES